MLIMMRLSLPKKFSVRLSKIKIFWETVSFWLILGIRVAFGVKIRICIIGYCFWKGLIYTWSTAGLGKNECSHSHVT